MKTKKKKPCTDCKEVKEIQKLADRKQDAAFTEEQREKYKLFTQSKGVTIQNDQVIFLCETYADVFKVPFWKPTCYTCKGTADAIKAIINKLDKVYESN